MGGEDRNPLAYGRGPGFVVWMGPTRSPYGGFVTWVTTGVVESSPDIGDAWHFDSISAANDAVAKGLGPRAENVLTTVFPAEGAARKR